MKKLLIILLFCLPWVVNAQTFHFIMLSDINDNKVGPPAQKVHDYMVNRTFLPNIKTFTNMTVNLVDILGNGFTKSNLESKLTSINSGSNDVIFLYYCGHGFNVDNSTEKFPQLYFGTPNGKWLSDVYKTLQIKPHRLLIVLAEACNGIVTMRGREHTNNHPGSFTPIDRKTEKYRKLFCESSGDYLMSSSSRGELSHFSNGWGYFSRAFIDVFDAAVKYDNNPAPSWDMIFDQVVAKTKKLASDDDETQNAQWIKGYLPSPGGKPASPDAIAQYNRGASYFNAQNYTEAVKCFRIAANQGHADAQFWLGYCYLKGLGDEHKDDYIALLWLEKSAEQGNAKAQYYIGWCYENGRGRRIDKETAMQWYRKSAAQGYEKAIQKLR